MAAPFALQVRPFTFTTELPGETMTVPEVFALASIVSTPPVHAEPLAAVQLVKSSPNSSTDSCVDSGGSPAPALQAEATIAVEMIPTNLNITLNVRLDISLISMNECALEMRIL
jgi:hypothetical protein